MTLEQSLKLFKITDITNIDKAELKKIYKKLMIKYHPDNNNGDDTKAKEVSLAYEVLVETIDNVNKYKLINHMEQLFTIVIPLSKLIEVYNGGVVTIGEKTFDKRGLRQNNTLIIINTTIERKGQVINYSNICKLDMLDNYLVNCELYVEDICEIENLKVTVENKSLNIDIQYLSTRILLRLQHDIKVSVCIEKKVRAEDKYKH